MKRNFLLQMVMVGFFSLVILQMIPVLVGAQTQSGTANEESTFQNPAQAAHAENLANTVAKTDPDVQKAFTALTDAEKALAAAQASRDKNAITAAQKAYDSALAKVEGALAKASGTATADISAMRAQGMGWGQIAHELGVHPGTLGLGHSKGVSATERDSKTGLAVGHSMTAGIESSEGSKGSGNAYAYGHSKGADGSPGAGNSGGQGGGHGGGNGGGHGGGHGNSK